MIDPRRQAALGQFFTPQGAATLIASMPTLPAAGTLRVLDPGAGSGSLTAALVSRALEESPNLRLEVVAVEIDSAVVAQLRATLEDAAKTAKSLGRHVKTKVVVGDFVDIASRQLVPSLSKPFDLVIMNPPYRKLSAASQHRIALAKLGVDCPNLYAAFVALAAKALAPNGQLVAITPQSFTNGPHFSEFRHFILQHLTLNRIHLFKSRSTVFSDTGVLQENIVFSATRGGPEADVTILSSHGHADSPVSLRVRYDQVVLPGDTEKFIRVPSTGTDLALAQTMAKLPCRLSELKLRVSTGKVVDFRSTQYLRDDPCSDCVPLVYPGNLRSGIVEWPRGIRKPQGFLPKDLGAQKLLLPSGCYVVVKRFSAKEERKRVVAAVWDPKLNGNKPIAFENHLNVIHSDGAGLSRDLAVGLSLWLNSTFVDRAFRTFSGHTQVNATDLRSMRFPNEETLSSLGSGQPLALPEQEKIDALVAVATPTAWVECSSTAPR